MNYLLMVLGLHHSSRLVLPSPSLVPLNPLTGVIPWRTIHHFEIRRVGQQRRDLRLAVDAPDTDTFQ